MTELSNEAKVLMGTMWKFSPKMELTFHRPHILTEKMATALSNLVECGYLTSSKLNHLCDATIWTPTDKMYDKPEVSMKFCEKYTFVMTIEEPPVPQQPKDLK